MIYRKKWLHDSPPPVFSSSGGRMRPLCVARHYDTYRKSARTVCLRVSLRLDRCLELADNHAAFAVVTAGSITTAVAIHAHV